MTLGTALLALGDRQGPGGFLATNLGAITAPRSAAPAPRDPIFRTSAPLERQRWEGIVIHHLGAPAGDPESISRQHQGAGYHGLGYHFLIGNGNGLGDGVIHAGYRWDKQLPGMHTIGPAADQYNRRTIGICLIGNGDQRPFTERQIRHLSLLIRGLQDELGIPAARVRLHRDVAPGQTTGPGRFFPTAQVEELLLR
jgi:hypothetical protein